METGAQGAQGPQGPAGPSGVATVVHGSDPTLARPNTTVVFWYGSVQPNNWTSVDIWVQQ